MLPARGDRHAESAHLIHAYATLGEWSKALAWDDRLHARRSNITCPPFFRALLLLGAEQWQPAIELLLSPEVVEGAEQAEIDVRVSRAEALRASLIYAESPGALVVRQLLSRL